ncbi:substrate-binding domain-containing protein [Planctomycetota bacterium]
MSKYAQFHGPWTFFLKPPYDPASREKGSPSKAALSRPLFDAALLSPTQVTAETVALNCPTMLTASPTTTHEGMYWIEGDNAAISRLAVDYFVERGYRNLAYCGLEPLVWSCQRKEAFADYGKQLVEKVYLYDRNLSRKTTWEKELGDIVTWLGTLPKPIALLAGNDDRAQQVVQACHMAQIKVPEEISILGIDNDDLICTTTNPPISSIELDFELAGYRAAERLDHLMKNESVDSQIRVSPTQVVTRQSSDIMAIEDTDVVEALSYIRKHHKTPLQVSQVAEAVAVSQRTMQLKFKRYLGRSIHEEITRVRVNHIARLLVETTMPISQIATSLGFVDDKHIAKLFRAHKGMVPHQYRQEHQLKK